MRESVARSRGVQVDLGSVALRRVCSMCEAELCVADIYDVGPSDGGPDLRHGVYGVQIAHVEFRERESFR